MQHTTPQGCEAVARQNLASKDLHVSIGIDIDVEA
jgi:hypothetical protein